MFKPMAKLWKYLSNNILKIGIGFLIAFIALYPKLPSIGISHTWVYIRLEDFFILALALIWFIQLVFRKVKINLVVSWPILIYLAAGLLSLAFSLIYIGPYIANFFPSVAILSYIRRIEYIILFFIALSTVKSVKDLRDYLIILSLTVLGFSLYGIGQHYYLDLWQFFPKFFQKYSFCFPSFQTGNEEFAKGIPLCLPQDARVTSTFAGHYDLSAYLVLIIPIFIGIYFSLKKSLTRKLLVLLTILSVIVLILTSSRISFVAYLISITLTLFFLKRKKFILPLVIFSILLVMIFSGSLAKRFMQTFRFASVVTNNQGQVIGQTELPNDLKQKLEKDKLVLENIPSQNLPEGSGFIGLPQKSTATNSALIQRGLSIEEARRLKLANGGVEISSISGSFLIKKVLVYDISFTTRFQAEWPNAWKAYLRNPFLGSGFSTITLATDNDFLRMLGETGGLGLFSFIFIFIVFGLILRKSLASVDSALAKGYLLGISGGVIGLFFNASLIDVFEASKVAESLWILLGIGLGVILLFRKQFNLKHDLKKIFSSQTFVVIYLFLISLIFFLPSVGNFFIGDDFTWLKWAANSSLMDVLRYFVNSDGFFYRPVAKSAMFFLYTLFSFQPQGYHLFALLIHFLIAIAVYVVSFKFFKNKLVALGTAFLFLVNPGQGETLYWIATISTLLSSLFIVYGLLIFTRFRKNNSPLWYLATLVFYLLALGSYEMGIVFPFLMVVVDLFLKIKKDRAFYLSYIPFVLLIPIYYLIRQLTHTVAVGGNYSYSLVHLIPNTIGNFVGYWGVFIFGERFFAVYDNTRLLLKQNSSFVTITLLFLLALFILAIYLNFNNLRKLFQNNCGRIFFFSIVFSFVSLLPFLGLGNIAERYGYLSSIGYSFALTVLIIWIAHFSRRITKNRNFNNYFIALILVLLGAFYWKEQLMEKSEWERSAKITNRTLAYFRIYHEDIQKNSNLYFANVPIKQGQAWIFPVGLEDGLWFIYRDPTLKIIKLGNEAEARSLKKTLKNTKSQKNYVFYFDKNGTLVEIN